MSIRRRHGTTNRSITYEDLRSPVTDETSSPSSLAAQAIRASSAHRDSSLSSAYGESAISSACRESSRQKFATSPQDSTSYEYTSMKSSNESKHGFWGVLARKAKAILEDDNVAQEFETPSRNRSQWTNTTPARQFSQSYQSPESHRKMDNPSIQKGLDAITSSLNFIGDTIGKSLEEGLTIVENRTNDIIQETRKLNIRRKGSGSSMQNQAPDLLSPQYLHQIQTDHETQLKASRDVANAMTAKTKLLMRELKTVKADLAFAKERCAQLEEENKILRESREKGDSPEDDDLIRLQLETLLAEKARLAHENSMYARENRFLREIVEYHQLTMQDVVYLDEGIEEVTEVYPIQFPATTSSQVSAQEVTPSVIQPPLPAPKAAGSLPIPMPPPSAELSPPTSTASVVQEALEVPSQNEEARPRPIKAAGDAKSEPETEGGDCSTID